MKAESTQQRSQRILSELALRYPGKKAFDLTGGGQHFVCEVEPTQDHPNYDRAVEVIIQSKPHKHLQTTQYYKVLSGTLKLHLPDKVITLHTGDKYTIEPKTIHSAVSNDECWLEIVSKPGWTAEDHVLEG